MASLYKRHCCISKRLQKMTFQVHEFSDSDFFWTSLHVGMIATRIDGNNWIQWNTEDDVTLWWQSQAIYTWWGDTITNYRREAEWSLVLRGKIRVCICDFEIKRIWNTIWESNIYFEGKIALIHRNKYIWKFDLTISVL